MEFISLSNITRKITPFEKELLGMFPKIAFSDMMGNLNPFGYKPRKDMIYLTYDLPRVSHEIAHMVEMKNFNRLLKDDWGLYSDTSFHGPWPFDNPKFAFRAGAREARVKAIESFLCKSEYEPGKILSKGWYKERLYPHLGFGKFAYHDQVDDWMLSIFETTQKQWSLDRIQHEWKRRVEYIRHWQETK